jgi:hypothetical protein
MGAVSGDRRSPFGDEETDMNKTRVGAAAAAIVALCLSLGAALAGPAPDKHPELDTFKGHDAMVALAFKQTDIRKVFDSIEHLGAFTFTYGEGFPSGKKISCEFGRMTLKEVLSQLADEHGLTYEVPSENTLLINGAAAKP